MKDTTGSQRSGRTGSQSSDRIVNAGVWTKRNAKAGSSRTTMAWRNATFTKNTRQAKSQTQEMAWRASRAADSIAADSIAVGSVAPVWLIMLKYMDCLIRLLSFFIKTSYFMAPSCAYKLSSLCELMPILSLFSLNQYQGFRNIRQYSGTIHVSFAPLSKYLSWRSTFLSECRFLYVCYR